MTVFRYTKGAELESIDITWRQPNGTLYDFSTGWTFTVRVGTPGSAALLQKTSGITGAATAPNLVIAWSAAELDAIPTGSYHLDVTARIANNKDLTRTFMFQILDGVLAP